MKRIFWSFVFFMLLSGMAAAQRLPELAVPENYQISVAPDFDKDNFTGEETIQIRVLKATPEIVLNSVQIDFQDVTVVSAGATQTAKVSFEKQQEMVTLSFDTALQPGPATIHIKYTGILNDELRGLYLGKDKKSGKYAVTQFEATDARRAFPSFEEPAYKATFDLTVIA